MPVCDVDALPTLAVLHSRWEKGNNETHHAQRSFIELLRAYLVGPSDDSSTLFALLNCSQEKVFGSLPRLWTSNSISEPDALRYTIGCDHLIVSRTAGCTIPPITSRNLNLFKFEISSGGRSILHKELSKNASKIIPLQESSVKSIYHNYVNVD